MTSFAARHIFVEDAWLSPGEVSWDQRGRITSLRRARRGSRVHDVAVLPGLVNAHAHLQLPPVCEPSTGSFVGWIGEVMKARATMSPRAIRQRTEASLLELLQSGCTAVGEVDSTGSSPAVMHRLNVAGRCYQELTGFHLDEGGARSLVRMRSQTGAPACPPGLSPHAPYSASADVFRVAALHRRALSVHAAELPEEQQLLQTGRGPLRDLLVRLGRLPVEWRAPGVGAVRYLEQLGVLSPRTLLVHCQVLERGDAARIAASGSPIVVCPGTIRWFGRSPPPVQDWLGRGIPVALGTDSWASNRSMSMHEELRAGARLWPDLAPSTLFAMATVHGARALSRSGLGRLGRGGRADFVCVAAGTDAPESIFAAFIHGDLAPTATFVGGRAMKRVVTSAARH